MNDIMNWIALQCHLCLSAMYMWVFPPNSPGSSCISFRSESKVISGMGPALGQALAGFVGSSAGWRAPFALVGAAGLVMSLGRTCGCWRVFGFVGVLWVVQGFKKGLILNRNLWHLVVVIDHSLNLTGGKECFDHVYIHCFAFVTFVWAWS